MKQIYTKEWVSKTLKETGHLPQRKIEQHPDLPSHSTIRRLFKTTSMANVWKELSIPFTPQPSYTKEEVSKALKKTGYLTSRKIAQHPDLPSHSTIRRLFKTTSMANVWNELDIPVRYAKEEVSKALKKIGWLSQKDINQHSTLPSYVTVLNLFKTTKINNVWKELDIDIFGI
ncbi:MAG: hypothetical protein GY730_00025 [bacterium]|nr:hypothetical protein [bacterium]